jgi:pimeloyl-ACP methyl ester carboxylesterase
MTQSERHTPSESFATCGELAMRYLDWGGDGFPALALHGLASSAHWYDLVAPLLHHKYRVIAPDQRGHGKTTQAPSGYDWPTVAADAIGLLDCLGIEKAALFGHSWGGNVAVSTAALFPDRISALVLIDGGFVTPRFRPGTTWEDFRTRLSPRDVSGTRDEFLARMARGLTLCWTEDVQRIVQTMVYEDETGQICDILRPDNHAQVIRAMWDDPSFKWWPKVRCPTLIVPAGPTPERAGTPFAEMRFEMVRNAAETMPDCRVHWIPETIHDIGYHKPVELANAIDDFLAQSL